MAIVAAALVSHDFPQATKDILAAAEDGRISQAKVLNALIEARYPDSLEDVLSSRVVTLVERLTCGGAANLGEVRAAVQLMIAELRKHSPIYSWLLIRTWTASWPTAQRTQKGAMGCIFSCAPPAVDALPHALFCPTACRALSEARKQPPRSDLGSCIGRGSRAPGWTTCLSPLSSDTCISKDM